MSLKPSQSEPTHSAEAVTTSLSDAQREMEMARQVIAGLEQQCAAASRRAAAYRDELDQERRTVVALRRRLAQVTDGLRARPANPVNAAWSAKTPAAAPQASPPPARAGQRPTVRLAAAVMSGQRPTARLAAVS